jgi:hypothetical protein
VSKRSVVKTIRRIPTIFHYLKMKSDNFSLFSTAAPRRRRVHFL